ncbi:hypothetical protein [Aurantiacibacter gangjinensis]|uniref:Uncharacterized protein n=1 Tax=Aurantiacibacter gangjinensis TaxID=502682 RepID=A0A0G9MQK0_9SPHN|nr:hypothetical protein [Aurantiacibacter gangjinensis]APE28851.1 hypothetical protein BMF35_a2022 [Aurantiacibacter gangjinensis]KLE32990.1 hypothetical protein AAW01_03005 [Aurantiacibacter gangjinensis]
MKTNLGNIAQKRLPREIVPRDEREATMIGAVMVGEFTPRVTVTVRNLSQFGVGVSSHGVVPDIGERVRLTLVTGDEIAGEVRWTDGCDFGLRMAHAFDLRRLRAINRLRDRLTGQVIAAVNDDTAAPSTIRGTTQLRPVC